MYVVSDLGVLGLFNVLGWLVALVLAGNVSAGLQGAAGPTLRPRFLPRDQLVSLPIVARGVVAATPPNGNTTVNATNPNVSKSSAGWSPLPQSKDRQSYFAVIQVGGINFRVVLDTGSSDLWLVSSACETEACKGIPKYPLSYQSPSFQGVNGNATVFDASYADGSAVSGFIAKEKVELAGLVVANQTFGLISNSTVPAIDQESGFLGLGFPRLSSVSHTVTNSTPFFASLAQQGLLNYPLFGFSLTQNLSGSLSLGAIDASIVTDPRNISWNSVAQFSPFNAENSNTSSYLQWAIPLSSFGVNGTQLAPLPSQANATGNVSLALFDVGAPGIYGSYQDVSRLYGLIDGSRLVDADNGQWVVPCGTNIPLTLTFGIHTYILHPSDYLIGPASGNPNLCLSWPRALPPSADGVDWQIGSAFLQTVYSIFSYGIDTKESPKIGLYPLSNTNIITNTIAASASAQAPPAVVTSAFTPQTTIPTTLPNLLIPTPTFTTPPYTFNTSVPASVGGIVSSGLATSTYHAILAQATTGFNASAIPTISPAPSVVTFTMSDGKTTVSTYSLLAATLGVPPGRTSTGVSLSKDVGRSFGVVVVQFFVFWALSGI
ncbi:acid protease [Macrolepiota fuliginosa MF-IS2]|uniref:Acid protease n=1 Tax=Macrolepiota fuliginosa MF-IS2 TaxID=1400762 RepID=A0A9P5XHB4_9AGAR|nr:acid protease [Macrolepiota fuliginosa MF-IS2]